VLELLRWSNVFLGVTNFLDDAKLGAFVAGEVDEVLFFEIFDRFLVNVADVGPFLSWLELSDSGVELVVNSA